MTSWLVAFTPASVKACWVDLSCPSAIALVITTQVGKMRAVPRTLPLPHFTHCHTRIPHFTHNLYSYPSMYDLSPRNSFNAFWPAALFKSPNILPNKNIFHHNNSTNNNKQRGRPSINVSFLLLSISGSAKSRAVLGMGGTQSTHGILRYQISRY